MFKEVSRLFRRKSAGLSLLCIGLLTLAALVAGPSSAAAAIGELTTTHWKNGSSQGWSLNSSVIISAQLGLATVTLSGPGISTPVGLTADATGTIYSATHPLTSPPVVGAAYTLNVTYLDNTAPAEALQVLVSNVIDAFATPVAPLGGVASASPAFSWTPPATPPGGFYEYNVSLSGSEIEWAVTVPSGQTTAAYGSDLPQAVFYDWSVAVVDSQGNRSESRASFMPGANFTGKVTDINGVGLAGVQIDVTDLAGNVQPTATTLSDGSYSYGGLATGSYKVTFSTDTASAYYKNRLDQPDLLPLTSGVLTTGVDAVLGGWGGVSGSVFLFGTGRPVTGVRVALYDASLAPVASVPAVVILSGGTGSFGNFYLGVIRPGNYQIKVTADGYADSWTPVAVTLNTTKQVGVTLTSGIPTINSFSVPATSASLTVSGISVSASEFNGVAGYLLTESSAQPSAGAAGWSATAPTSYTFAGSGTRTLYAWAKGSTGLVSAVTSVSTRTVTITANRTLTVQTSGAGSVNSTPSGIACVSGSTANCSASFTGGSVVTLVPSATSSTVFSGWSGACSGTGICQVAIDADKSVTAGFAVKPATVRIDGNETAYYNIGGTLDTIVTTGKTVRAKADSFLENVIMVSQVPVLLKGGYTDDAFSSKTGTSFTVIDGSLKIRRGALKVERLKVR